MVRTHHRFGLTAATCLIGFATSTWANEFPCVDDQCLPGTSKAAAAAPAAAAPAEEEEASRAGTAVSRGPAMFAAPTPSGEVEGARNSYSLPSIELSLPKMSFGLPEFRIRGMGRGRREAQMRLDEGTAPMATGAPAIYGPLLGAGFQQRAAASSAAPQKPADAAPATAPAEPAAAAPAGCVDARSLREQSEEVRQLSMQVQQLQGLLLQLAKQKAAEQPKVSSEDQEELSEDVSYEPPRKTRHPVARVASRPTPKSQAIDFEALEAAEAAAAERQLEIEESYAQKCAELEDMQARMEQIEIRRKQVLEANLQKISSDREKRVRSRIGQPQTEPRVLQSSYEDAEEPVYTPPKKLPSRQLKLKKVPTARVQVEDHDEVFGVQSNAPEWMRNNE